MILLMIVLLSSTLIFYRPVKSSSESFAGYGNPNHARGPGSAR